MLLFTGSLVVGWGFNTLDPEYVVSVFLPKTLSVALDSLLLAGVTIGIFFYKPMGALTLTNIFYIEPF